MRDLLKLMGFSVMCASNVLPKLPLAAVLCKPVY
jgi:hypothetical protein